MEAVLSPNPPPAGKPAWLEHCSVNYGIVAYKDWKNARLTEVSLMNPILFAFTKDTDFKDDTELRVTLSTLGIGSFVRIDGSAVEPPTSLSCPFDLVGTLRAETIKLHLDCKEAFPTLQAILARFGIDTIPA